MSIQVTIVGNLTSDLELRYTQGGKAVASGNVAVNERLYDKQANEWKDGDATFVRLNIWDAMGEYASGSLMKGTRVIVTGKLKNRPWEDKDGNKRTSLEMQVDEIGPSLKYAVASVTRQQRTGGAPQEPRAYSQHGDDPGEPQWATESQAAQAGVSTQPALDEPWATPGSSSSYDSDLPF